MEKVQYNFTSSALPVVARVASPRFQTRGDEVIQGGMTSMSRAEPGSVCLPLVVIPHSTIHFDPIEMYPSLLFAGFVTHQHSFQNLVTVTATIHRGKHWRKLYLH